MTTKIKPFENAEEAEKALEGLLALKVDGVPVVEQALDTIRAQEAEIAEAADALNVLAAIKDAEIARLRQENTDYAQDAKDTLPLYDKIDQLTAALAQTPHLYCATDSRPQNTPADLFNVCSGHTVAWREQECARVGGACKARAAQPKDCPHGQHPYACGLCFDNCENCNQETGESCPKHGGGHEPNRPAQPESRRPCPRCGADCEWKAGEAWDVFRFHHFVEGFGSVSSRWNPCVGSKPRGIRAAQDKEKSDAQE